MSTEPPRIYWRGILWLTVAAMLAGALGSPHGRHILASILPTLTAMVHRHG